MAKAIEPFWIREDIVYAVHRYQIAEHGGDDGVRDPGLLASALAKAKSHFSYGDPPPDISRLAAAYAFGIARNHPFVDGNKRTAFVVCRTFLKINGYDLNASQEEKYETFLALADGRLSEEELAIWIHGKLLLTS